MPINEAPNLIALIERYGSECIERGRLAVVAEEAEWEAKRDETEALLAQIKAFLLRESVSVTLTETDRSDLRVAANIIDRDGPSPIGVELSATLRRIASAGIKEVPDA